MPFHSQDPSSMEHPSPIQNLSLIPSPNSRSSASSTSSSATATANPIPITRSEPNSPYPTTFVQADTSSFKQVVQMLTGSNETPRHPTRPESARHPIPPTKTGPRKDKSTSKLYERRKSFRNFKISPLGPATHDLFPGYSGSPRPTAPEILSPSILDFPSLMLSPVTPLIPDPFNRNNNNTEAEEERAIKEKGFYLHPSPATTPRESEPRLLPLFPVTSPRVAGSSNAE